MSYEIETVSLLTYTFAQIKEVIGEHAHVLELRVAKEDLGKVIGKGGAHASAIRTLMAATSGKEKKRYILEIIEY